MSADALDRLAAELRAGDGLIAAAACDPAANAPTVAVPGPRSAADPDEYALLVEAIHEGYLQHYGSGRVLRTDDEDLALLAGDHLYAVGLDRLAALGDLQGVVVLADLISACARAHAEDRLADAAAAWRGATRALTGASD